ncbi:hypothetical protein SALB1_2532 [Salinisphaera sp. LB1]|nr:hypothetical protein SALB1_2532 [Salinisphaera sp. LB1]
MSPRRGFTGATRAREPTSSHNVPAREPCTESVDNAVGKSAIGPAGMGSARLVKN